MTDATSLHGPWLAMVAALVVVLALAWRPQRLDRHAGIACLALYPVVVAFVLST